MKSNQMVMVLMAFVMFFGFSANASQTEDSAPPAEKSEVVVVKDSESFYKLLDGDTPILVDFYATWCRPCRIQDPIIKEIASEMKGKVIVVKLDVDKFPRISSKYEVSGIPCLIYFDESKEVWRKVGLQEKEEIKAAITKAQRNS